MIAVLLLAAYLRIHDLNAQGIWGDEGWSIWLARGDSLRDLTLTMVHDHHGPVYSILLRVWYLLGGETVVAQRMLAALFSVGSVALIARLGRALFSPAAGVLAALAFTLMDKQVVLAQEIRDYPMVFFTMIAIAYTYVQWRKTPDRGWGFGFVAATIFGLYLHYYCYMVNLAILAHALITLRDRRIWRHFAAINAAPLLAFLPWVFVAVHQFVITPVDSEVLNIHGMPLNRHTIEYLATESLGEPLALFGLLLFVGGLGSISERLPGPMMRVRRDKRLSAALLAALWFSVPIFITTALHTRYPLLTDRNISVIMPAIALLVGFGLTAFERISGTFLVGLVVVNGVFTTSSFYDKPPWRELAADVAARHPAGEPVLLDVEGAHAALWYHTILALDLDTTAILNTLPEEDTNPVVVSLYDLRKRYGGRFVPALQQRLDGVPGLWLAYWGDEFKKHDVLDVLAGAGFVRTGTLNYDHLGNPIYAHRYDRVSALQEILARFGGAIRLHKVMWPDDLRRGDTPYFLLWWSADDPPLADYTVSVFLLDSGGVLRAQHDGIPAEGARPFTTWTPGDYVFDAHPVRLPDDLPPGDYTVGVKLYTWWDGAILPPTGGVAGSADYAVVGRVTVR